MTTTPLHEAPGQFDPNPCRLYTPTEVAELLGTGRDYVYTQIHAGRLTTIDLGAYSGRAKTRVRATDLAAFITHLHTLTTTHQDAA